MQLSTTATVDSGMPLNTSWVLLALTVSVSFHTVIFMAWPHMQGSLQSALVVQGELIAPVTPEPPPKTELPKPEVKAVVPPPPAKVETKPKNEPPSPVRPDTGVALPVLAAKAPEAPASSDYVVKDAPPLTAEDKLPFGSRVGNVAPKDYVPSDGPPGDATPPANPDADDEVDKDTLGEFANAMREKASTLGSYPAIATKRGWQGKVKVLVRFNSDGTPRQFTIQDSSGRKVLDDQALEMVRKAASEIDMPSKLTGKKFSVVVPVDFKLQ